jgi:cystathionine beta-lyase
MNAPATPYDFDTVIDRRNTGSTKWSAYPADVHPMWVADMDFAAPPEVVAALARRVEHGVFGYAVPTPELRDTIVADMKARYDWVIQPEDLVFLPGVVPGFNMALKALLMAGDGIVVNPPVYPPILAAAAHWDMRRLDVPFTRSGDGWAFDKTAFETAIADARAYILCNPHNPIGKVFSRAELEEIAATCLKHNVTILSDEIHCDLVFDGRKHVPIASLSPEIAEHTVTLMAASKTYNVAGLKCAFAIIPDKRIRAKLENARLGMVDSINPLGLEATLSSIRDGGPWLKALLTYLQANRDHLVAEVKRRLPGVTMTVPEGTYLAWLDCSGLKLDEEAQRFFLREAKVAFNAGSSFGEGWGDHVRLNFGCPRAELDKGLDRLEAALKAR